MSAPYPPPYNPPYPPQPAPPQYAPPSYNQQPPPRKKGGKGCMVAILVVLVLVGGVVVAGAWGLKKLGDKASTAMDAVGTVKPCPYVTNAEASEALGTPAEADLLTGGFGKVMNIIDIRVLADQDSCILQQTGSTGDDEGMPGLGRVVKYQGTDAATRYKNELVKAKGITTNQGNGMSTETEAYFNKTVPNLGDEAFCTKTSGTIAGVLVRKGQTLVYVAVVKKSTTTPSVDLADPDNAKLSVDDPACEGSQVLAHKILAR